MKRIRLGIIGLLLALIGGCAGPWAAYPVVDGAHRVQCARLDWEITTHPAAPPPAGVVVPVCDGVPLPVVVTTSHVELPR